MGSQSSKGTDDSKKPSEKKNLTKRTEYRNTQASNTVEPYESQGGGRLRVSLNVPAHKGLGNNGLAPERDGKWGVGGPVNKGPS